MEQNPGNGGNGGYEAPQGYVPQAVYTPPVQPKKAGIKPWVWIVGGAGLVVLVVVLVVVLSTGSGGGGSYNPEPLLYMDGDDIYLAAGKESIQLDDASLVSGNLNATISSDRSKLYYLADVSSSSGEGDLMCIRLGNANAEPERIAEDVYSARISADGNKVLYITDYEDYAGELFICSPGGRPTSIGEDVADYTYGFSPNGSYAYFVVSDDEDRTLMLYSGGNEAEEVYDTKDEESIDSVYVDDNGRVLFDTYSYSDATYEYEYTLYIGINGKTDRVSSEAYFVTTFNSAEEFLYATSDNELIYYNKGDEETITDDFAGVRFPFSGYYDPRDARGKHFLYRETKSSGSGVSTMYEISLPGKGVKVGKTDGSYSVDADLRYIAYEWEGSLYLAHKSGGKWDDDEVCEDVSYFEFDESGSYLYYIADSDGYSGDLCRIPTASGKEEELLDDVTEFLLWNGSCYAVNDDGDVYLVKNKKNSEKLENDITSLYAAQGGIYAVGYGSSADVYYISGGESERVGRGVDLIWYYGYIAGSSY